MEKIQDLNELLFVGDPKEYNWRDSWKLASKEISGDIDYYETLKPIIGEVEAGKPVSLGGKDISYRIPGRQASADLYYFKGFGFVATISAPGEGMKVDYYLLKAAKVRNKKAEEAAVEEFCKAADELMEAKKKEAGITYPGEIRTVIE